MKKAIIALLVAVPALSCARTGLDAGSSCSVKSIQEGALIVCTDGTQALVRNGTDGTNGANGQSGTNGTDGTDGESCQTPASTYHMMNYKLIATEERDRWLELSEERYAGCPGNGTADTPEECYDNYLIGKYSAHRYYATRGNWFPKNECGAQVMVIVKTMEEYVAEEGLYAVWHRNTEDTDGDGITNYHEYFMGLNPCTLQSYGCANDADGDFDYDGVPNGEDHSSTYGPYCPEDASYWPAECV